jgi:hypothetical protein
MAIARARVYHSVPFDVRNLVTASAATLRRQGPPDDQVVETFERAITPNTRAALITYLFGIAADPTPLIDVAARAGLFIIEDFSHNLGASVGGRSLGTFGDVERGGLSADSGTSALGAGHRGRHLRRQHPRGGHRRVGPRGVRTAERTSGAGGSGRPSLRGAR